MPPTSNIHHLPNGQTLTVLPVFGGFYFKANEWNTHNAVFPAGWTVIMQSEDFSDDETVHEQASQVVGAPPKRQHHIHPFRKPTLHNDSLFISSISNPSSSEFKSATSPTRQIAMMLWSTLNWYFHLPPPSTETVTTASRKTPAHARPKGEWKINIKKEGVFRGRNLIQKLERMGLIITEDSVVGTADERSSEGWTEMFTSRRLFWQLSARLFLFTLSPALMSFPATPYGSRPSSPVRGENRSSSPKRDGLNSHKASSPVSESHAHGPFSSGSHLPTYYPPAPLQYTISSSGVRHPIRPKPPRQGETFYRRYVPSIGQWLSFRTASISSTPVFYTGPGSSNLAVPKANNLSASNLGIPSISDLISSVTISEKEDSTSMSDVQLLHSWMNIPRVSAFWNCDGPQTVQEEHLRKNLSLKHSFPVIGLWDDKPFGYFELYWVKEDILGQYAGSDINEFDRGIHCLVGEEEFRGPHRVSCWLTALAHWAFISDYRTNSVVLEPRIDNERYVPQHDLNVMGGNKLIPPF